MSTRDGSLSLGVLVALGLALSPALAQSPPAQSQPASATASPASSGSPAAQTPSKSEPASGVGTPAKKSSAKKANTASPPKSATPSPNLPARFAGRAGLYYKMVWGIDSLSVKWTESGEMIRFSYRVVDPSRAAPLNDKRAEPSLIDPGAGVSLVVPTMEKIGQLRQSATPEAGKSYWIAFSNKGRIVKRGDRVDVVIGPFRAENLVVD
ncbi:MAG: hypothetical protein JO347_01315 [Candidatus Eremiobacteraeota bacterium]|nr:hypothetical protein [Candidatus Eremiobacteraeota bacterium]